ncbi:MAG: acetoacetate--CoA ligase [Alphaproteobacteria bacterium]|nr:acetoacetate--CoA ligase [Alphaproteobacteria bacterium]
MNEPAPILWQPSPEVIEARNLTAFAAQIKENLGLDFGRDYDALWRWSVTEKGAFWRECWKFLGIVSEGPLEPALVNGDSFAGATWFPEVRLNYAETILKWPDDQVALAAVNEAGARYELTFADLRAGASRAQQALAASGVEAGTRVGAILLNTPESIMAMLGATSLGAVWTSVSPDFGAPGMLDRLAQAAPEVLFAVDGYTFAGKRYDVREKIAEVVAALPSVREIIVLGTEGTPDIGAMNFGTKAQTWDDFHAPFDPAPMAYTRLPFDHPLFILYTSGTTGIPKCIVHSAGGSMLKSVGEHAMLFDLKPSDTAFFPTTLGWMMWNFLVNYLGTGAKIVCYDGSPFYPDTGRLWQLAADEGVTVLGLGSSYIEACRKNGFAPDQSLDLSAVRKIIAGGSVLSPEGFDYVYEHIARDVHLSSGSGGTEIMGCLLGSNPWGPVRRGELQAPALGMDMAVLDTGGAAISDAKGELVCRSPFPSLPLGLLGDADGARFQETYFSQNPGNWTQGDFAESVADSGGYIVYGRSDATLNPGGVRIGTAEIYRQVDKVPEVLESVVVGQNWQQDVRVVLFVRLQGGVELNEALADKIRATARAGASPRHVPRKIVQVDDIPKTRTGKIAEIAVRDLVNGDPVGNREALANADALDAFANRAELRD